MRAIVKSLCLVLIVLWTEAISAEGSSLESLRIWNAPERTRLVFDVSDPRPHRIFSLQKPKRLVIDLSHTKLNAKLVQPASDHPIFSRMRSGVRNESDLRVVLDLKVGVKPQSFQLKPNKKYGHRLVVDLYADHQAIDDSVVKPKKQMVLDKYAARDLVIAIDAGHGGEDPGALGRRGINEKHVVLAIAKQLSKLVQAEQGMSPVLIRTGDYYLGLRKRIKKARDSKADLFVSIHADAVKNSNVRGASVYTLSKSGATSEAAKWLAETENAADLIGGIKLGDKGGVLAKVLLDLSQTATLEASYEAGKRVLKYLKKTGRVHKYRVQKARFVVLKSPDIPSILVETAFISNPLEEKNLNNPSYQKRLAKAIFKGIREYFLFNAPPGTHFAAKKHIIIKGETLSGIAQQYGVSMNQLRAANSLTGTRIQIGQVLTIPIGS